MEVMHLGRRVRICYAKCKPDWQCLHSQVKSQQRRHSLTRAGTARSLLWRPPSNAENLATEPLPGQMTVACQSYYLARSAGPSGAHGPVLGCSKSSQKLKVQVDGICEGPVEG